MYYIYKIDFTLWDKSKLFFVCENNVKKKKKGMEIKLFHDKIEIKIYFTNLN